MKPLCALVQVRYLQGENDRLKEKLAHAERSAAAAASQKVRLSAPNFSIGTQISNFGDFRA
jgi:hypothetical protein